MNDDRRNEVIGDRGIPSVALTPKKKGGFTKYIIIVGFFGLLIALSALAFSKFVLKKDAAIDPEENKKGHVAQTLPQKTFLPPKPDAVTQERDSAKKGSDIQVKKDEKASGSSEKPPLTPVESLQEERYASSMTPKAQAQTGGSLNSLLGAPSGNRGPDIVERSSSGRLGGLLASTSTPPRQADIIKNRTLTLAKGAMIPCVLKTRIDSTVPGMTSCVLPQNIYSDDGKTVLVERGSEIVGEYQSGLTQGQERLFVLWTRIKTTKGVIISLDSPGADPLGGAGMPGYVDNHFFKRFGAAILLSLIGDGLQTLTQAAQNQLSRNQNGNTVVYQNSSANSQQLATEALKGTINIPPTLYKNQGDRISIFVARDLAFDSIYEIKPL